MTSSCCGSGAASCRCHGYAAHSPDCVLQEEVAALEAANVYAILESGPLVEGVIGQLRHTQTVLDDLDESLKVPHDTLCTTVLLGRRD